MSSDPLPYSRDSTIRPPSLASTQTTTTQTPPIMSSDTPQELRQRDIESSVSRTHGFATSSKTLKLEPYFWWTRNDFAWGIVSRPWREPAGDEETSDIDRLLQDIQTTARVQQNRFAPWTAEEWSNTVNKAVQTVQGQPKWSEYKVKLLPMTTTKPTELTSPVLQNEMWRRKLAESSFKVGVAHVESHFEPQFFGIYDRTHSPTDANLIEPVLGKISDEWSKDETFDERMALVDSWCKLDGPPRDTVSSDYWTSRLLRAIGDSIIEENLDIAVLRGPPPPDRPPPSLRDKDPSPDKLLLFGRRPAYRRVCRVR